MAATLKDIEYMIRKATRPVPERRGNVALSLDYLRRYRPEDAPALPPATTEE